MTRFEKSNRVKHKKLGWKGTVAEVVDAGDLHLIRVDRDDGEETKLWHATEFVRLLTKKQKVELKKAKAAAKASRPVVDDDCDLPPDFMVH